MANIEERVETLIQGKVQELGYSLYDVQYAKEGQSYYLRIFIEKPNDTISLDDCEKVNNAVNELLDKADYIKEQYFLEISSTGVEKLLRKDKHLEDNIGNEVRVSLFKSVEIDKVKHKEIVGVLKGFDENEVVLELESGEIGIDRKNVSQIKTVYNWDE